MKAKLYIVTVLASLITTAQAHAGASNTMLNCKSADGKWLIEGDVPGDLAEFRLTTKMKDNNGWEVLELYAETNQQTGKFEETGKLTIMTDLENGVFALQATDLEKDPVVRVQLYAIPKTMKVKKGSGAGIHSTFTANLSVASENGGGETKVTCRTDYEL